MKQVPEYVGWTKKNSAKATVKALPAKTPTN